MNYEKIQIGDRVDYRGNDAFGAMIRLNTAGIKKMFDYSVPTHTGIVCKFDNQYLVAGMRKKISLESLEDKHVLGIYRHENINEEAQTIINGEIAIGFRRHLDYDYTGMLAMCPILAWLKQNNAKYFCSEFYVWLTRSWIKYTKNKYSPYDLFKMDGFRKVV